ncbi:MAG: InlB B-repeat-containing protein [Spirochaetales bacterium]|nr:InlB B-repeat-containing protein [Spirochaetales bacterium]
MKNMAYKHFRITIKVALICIAALMILSCGGGGGGGGGMVAFQDNPGIHNNGDAGGFGTGNQTGSGFDPQGQNIEDAEAGPLISQMAALDVTTVDIQLTVNNEPQPLIVADATTTTAVLPKIKPGYIVSGTATIHLADGTTRTAVLDETEATLHGVLKFKVPYNYTANDLSGTQVASGTYFSRDGINLAAQTVDPIAGWQCAEDGSIHYGGYVAGVRGDITLNAVLGDGAPALTATASQNVLYATATSSDTATITVTGVTGTPQVSSISTELAQQGTFAQDSSDSSKYTLTVQIKDDPSSTMGAPIWFSDNTATSVTITDDSGATTSVPLTLKNKYSYVLLNHAGEGGTITRGPENAGYELTFANAKSIASAYSTSVPAGRSIIAFKDTTTNTVYKETDFPITFNSTNFSSRSITLQAMLDFGMTVTGGKGDGNTHTGTEADPYILKYNGTDNTDATKITVNVTGNEGSIIARSDRTGLTIGHSASGDTTQYITIQKTALAATDIPAEGLKFKITVRDYQAGADGAADNDAYLNSKRTFWVKIPQPEYTVSFNTAGGSAVDDISVPMGINSATLPSPGPVKTNCVFWGWYTDAECTTPFDFSSITGDAIAYAKWLAVDETISTVITSGDGLAAYVNTDGNKYLLSLQDFNYTAGVWESATKFVNNNAGSTTDMYIDIQGTNKFIGGNHGGLKFVNIYSGWDPSSPGGTINVSFCTASSGTLELGFQYSGTNGCIQTDYVTVNFSVASGCTVSEMKIGNTEYSNFDSFISDARTNTDSSKRATFKITRN